MKNHHEKGLRPNYNDLLQNIAYNLIKTKHACA